MLKYRVLGAILFLIATFCNSEAQNVLRLGDIEINQGEKSAELLVELSNQSLITGFQCDLYLPEGVEVASDEYGDHLISLERTTAKRHTISTMMQSDCSLRILCTSMTNLTFTGNEGVVLRISLDISDISAGKHSLQLKNIVLSDPEANRYESPEAVSHLFCNSQVQNVLRLGDIEINQGEKSAELLVELSNQSLITGFQCDLYLPEGVEVASDEYGDHLISLERTTAKRHTISTMMQSDCSLRILCTSMTNLTFTGNEGVVLRISLDISDISAGKYSLQLKNIVLSDPEANRYVSSDVEAYLSVNEIIITPLDVVSVNPANGAEVESLNIITLTFAEAVTVNAEAGAITLVNNSNQNLDYAKNFNVTISEDGLIATITCVPGYPNDNPRWTNNATYKLNVPTGYFVATSGATSDALEYSWKIAAAKFTYVDVTPAQGEVTELSEILIGFANRAYGNSSLPTLNLVDADGNVVTTASTARAQNANGDWYAIKATLKDKVTAPGTYTLVVPADVFKDTDLGDGVTNAAFDLTWTVMEPDPNTYTLALNADPASGSTVSALDKITFTPGAGVIMFLATDEAKAANWAKVTDANGNSYNSKIDLSGQYWALTIEDATEASTYTVVIPKKSFYDALNATNFNDEIVLTYTIKAANPNTYTLAINANPASGSTLKVLDNISFSAATAGVIAMPTTEAQSAGWFSITDANGNSYKYTTKVGVGLDLTIEGATVPGIYTVVVPAKSFVDAMTMNAESKNYNAEMVLTYIVEGETVEDFTPVVTPAAGDITVDQMNVTVISVDSPIVSFDDSYVRYIKAIGGNVWFVGSYKISDDKLTLTLNWDLIKGNYPPGTSYTLELPAGCIVLENGAKNLLTQVAYTVVAGTKDLAEFVVPAGINGYINYDETDVNAWAPEFPFTVSTTAYNTVAFAAELPSLPAQLATIEVIDSNDQVIALLDYAHDGVIYHAEGETTKEYADGAELKFRFRFTHLGVSETIQFSYIVAGGNITSIADVELDGNVIVRGNDIIAPQGAAIFTVSGIRVPAEGLAPGVYVVVLGNQTVKVMVK